jgi:BASS family bile acid:Na+ symporter
VTKIQDYLRNRNVIFLLAVTCGLFIPYAAPLTKQLVLPALALIMTLSSLEIPTNIYRSVRSFFAPAFLGIVMSYVILGNLIIGMSTYFIHEESLWTGFVIIAAVPPAVAVIPIARSLKGSETYVLAGVTGSYIGALIVVPMIGFGLLELHYVNVPKLITLIVTLIVIPYIVSRILLRKKWSEKIKPVKGLLTDWSYFLVVYSLVGLNQETIMAHPSSLMPVAFIAFASTFLLGFFIQWIGALFRLNKENLISLTLLGTLKNYGLAGGLALFLFAKETALPAAVVTFFMFVYTIWLNLKSRLV